MTANRIIEVALNHFAEHGYEGASLANIAEQVGIKTPSIYAHFKNKDDLFVSIIRRAVQEEMGHLQRYIQTHREHPIKDVLYGWIQQYEARYETSNQLKFLLRVMFFPPVIMQERVMELVNAHLDQMERELMAVFKLGVERAEIDQLDMEMMTASYMCLVDGILVEMLLGGPDRFRRRFDASWRIYWRSLTRD
ncbi:TetR/AcrR family transcriptional regulator [Paenibacillus sp. MER 180]|uniref:TetR/AcrR family transcriptional regulator n=1 Tax=unclassified Paenibacillus TaxID=185978 RepID=UPI0008065264|nr:MULTISPECIES: TetR/AcrR family transcriptional regulator [unclassified Paenibacillus]MCM3291580.1 TetR/AcrR family transcriptional regulator [Paenibacillus sp. MER 180]OBY77711.1 TetR family transcriptional regulator [Paenibacillus sp. KS1]